MHSIYFVSADQIYGDQEMHSVARRNCVDHMVSAHIDHVDVHLSTSSVWGVLSVNTTMPYSRPQDYCKE